MIAHRSDVGSEGGFVRPQSETPGQTQPERRSDGTGTEACGQRQTRGSETGTFTLDLQFSGNEGVNAPDPKRCATLDRGATE